MRARIRAGLGSVGRPGRRSAGAGPFDRADRVPAVGVAGVVPDAADQGVVAVDAVVHVDALVVAAAALQVVRAPTREARVAPVAAEDLVVPGPGLGVVAPATELD